MVNADQITTDQSKISIKGRNEQVRQAIADKRGVPGEAGDPGLEEKIRAAAQKDAFDLQHTEIKIDNGRRVQVLRRNS